ncbi:MAG: tetratricopeptide repeat protein, partial [Schleiferiaceae bacterium]|nr:tetratricopeptide repeat protein [Schleiferiaceae bacterium]
MKRHILFIVLCVSYFGKSQNLDSLFTVWQDKSESDSVRVLAYEQYLQIGISNKDPERLYMLADSLIQFDKEHNYPIARAKAYNFKGAAKRAQRQFDEAMSLHDQALQIYTGINFKLGIAFTLQHMATTYDRQYNFDLAIEYHTKCYEIFSEIGNESRAAKSLIKIGELHEALHEFSKALEFYKRSLNMRLELNIPFDIAESYWYVAYMYGEMKNLPKAEEYFKLSYNIYIDIDDIDYAWGLLNDRAMFHERFGNHEEAIGFYKQIMILLKERGNHQEVISTYIYQAKLYEKTVNRQMSTSMLEKCRDYANENQFEIPTKNLIQILIIEDKTNKADEIIQRHLELGNTDTNSILNAILNIDHLYIQIGQIVKALEIGKLYNKWAVKCGDEYHLMRSGANLGTIYEEGLKDYSKALPNYKEEAKYAVLLNDSASYGHALINEGGVYSLLGMYDSAEVCLENGLKISRRYHQQRSIAFATRLMGELYLEKGDMDRAHKYFKDAVEEGAKDVSVLTFAKNLSALGNSFLRRKEYEKGLKQCLLGWELSNKEKFFEGKRINCNCLFKIYDAQGNQERTLYFLKELTAINDLIAKRNVQNKVLEDEFLQQMQRDSIARMQEKQEAKIMHEQEIAAEKKKELFLIIGGLAILFIAGGIYSRLHYVRRSKASLQKEKDRSENLLHNILPEEVAAEL